jgi:peptidoglycan/LPS O-acetylase OafA/YrhL
MWFHLAPVAWDGLIISVDLFFVISGYLITRTQTAAVSVRSFYASRIRRMFPALLIVLITALIFGVMNLEPTSLTTLGKEIFASGLFLQNFWLASQIGYFDVASFEKPLLHLWTLSIEEQFYLIWPLILWYLNKFKAEKSFFLVFGLMTIFLLVTLVKSYFNPQNSDYYLPWMRVWAILAGCALAYFERTCLFGAFREFAERRYWPILNFVAITGAVLFFLAIGFTDRANHLKGMVVLGVVGSSLLILAGPSNLLARQVLAFKPLVWIGLVSYPLYLWHWFLKAVWLQSDDRLDLETVGLITKAPALGLHASESAVIAVCSLFLAAITWQLVEKPLRRRPLTGAVWSGLLAVLCGVLLCAGLLIKTKGLPERLDTKDLGLFADQQTELERYRIGTCFLARGEDFPRAVNPPGDCVDNAQADKPKVLLWGDSHAAQFVSALRPIIASAGWGFAQLTVAACSPFQSNIPSWCAQVLSAQRPWVENFAPELIILAGSWSTADAEKLVSLMRELKARGSKVVVLGPVPLWSRPLPILLQRQALGGRGGEADSLIDQGFKLQSRGLLPDAAIFDLRLRSQLSQSELISPLEVLCPRADACIASVKGVPTSWDQAHLTSTGAALVAPFIFDAVRRVVGE